ncbi:MAG: SUMF1/EgtB/PvdO family nonheme iron enzyme, partial [Sulfitobacter sp.]|nr:SUMF1/EgtB/PvdO family nonheme iron enzyme [Sulfitobacter sp.]
GLGFEVLIKTNSGKKDMLEAVRDFGNKSQGAEVALFFYAGHGMQVDGVNYLIPVGVDIEAEDEVAFEAVDANRILAKMERSSAKVNIVVLDACRDNPFRSFRSSTRGLTVVRAVRGSVLVYATAPGDVAADGTDRNSPFTTHLLDSIVTPGLRVDDVFRAVGLGVVRDTGGKQTPWMSSSLYGDYYLAGAPAQVPAPSASAANQPGLEKMLTEARHKEADKQNAALKVKAEREAARERVRVDVAKYHKLLSTPEGAALKDKAWQVIKFKHPNLTANIGEGETDALVALVVPEPGEGFVETSTGMEFIWVPGGCGVMGSPNWEPGRDDDEEPTIKVCVDGFWMGKYEVTQAQWQKLIGDNPSHFKGPDNPVAGVS